MTPSLMRPFSWTAFLLFTILILPLHAIAAGVIINGDAQVTNYKQVTLSLTSPSGGGDMSFKNESDVDWTPWETFSGSKQWTMSPLSSEYKTVSVRFRDALGNISDPYNDNIWFDQIRDLSFSSPYGAMRFGSTGKDVANAVALQPDGKIISVGTCDYGGGNTNIEVLRYNTNGTLDTSFNSTGYYDVSGQTGAGADTGTAVALQPDGKIVVAGNLDYGGTDSDFVVFRLNSNGTLDTTFNTTGYFVFGGTGLDSANGVAIQSDGKIVVIGSWDYGNNNKSIFLLRLASTGAVDSSFGSSGWFTFSTGYANQGKAVAIQSDGKIVFTGKASRDGVNSDTLLCRLTGSGAFDTSFNSPYGYVTFGSSGLSGGNALSIQPDGKVVVVGTIDWGANDTDIIVRRLNSDGTFDGSFGYGGYIYFGYYGSDEGRAVAIQPDGKILVAGAIDFGNSNRDQYLVRLNNDGTTDDTFNYGNYGYVNGSTDWGNSANGIAVQSDGKIVTVGSYDLGNSNTDMYIFRLHGSTRPLNATASGSGTVSAFPGTLAWNGTSGTGNFVPDSMIILTAVPNPGSIFASWGGACSGTATTCTVTMNAAKTVTATFRALPQYNLNVSFSGSGGGSINSITPGATYNCALSSSGSCPAASYYGGTILTLRATNDSNSRFGSWTGDCTGTGDCVLTMSASRNVTATYTTAPNTHIMGGSDYPTLTTATGAVGAGGIVQARAINFTENLAVNKPAGTAFTLSGGYDSLFNSNTGTYTTLIGKLTIVSGKLIVENIKVK